MRPSRNFRQSRKLQKEVRNRRCNGREVDSGQYLHNKYLKRTICRLPGYSTEVPEIENNVLKAVANLKFWVSLSGE